MPAGLRHAPDVDHFDLFISYHWRDHLAVEQLAQCLRQRGLRVFLDRWYLSPGQPWPERLEQILGAAGAAAVCVGPEGLGAWQLREQHLALERQVREPDFRVIPVLLPGSDPPLGFLRLNTWVDLREGSDGRTLDLLAAAALGLTPADVVVADSRGARASVCPFRGLLPFREEDADFFHGRQLYTDRLLAAVARHRVVAVVGASGSGKSSVVRAGLIPALRPSRESVWEMAVMVPTDRPVRALAEAMLALLEPGLAGVERLAKAGQLAAGLDEGSLALRDLVTEALRAQPGSDRLLLVVDQWEEVHTLCADVEERERFHATLLEAADRAPLSVVLTLRGDFYGRALSHRGLADALQDAVVNLGPMTRQELARAVVEPAERAGLRFEEGLVERILDDVGEEPGHLPLLEFLLEELWQARRGALLQHEAYAALGGVQGALAARAEQVYQRLGEGERSIARRLLIRLVRPGEGSDDSRRPALLAEAEDAERAVAQRLVEARLLVTARDESLGAQTVEVAHEALIRSWGQLREWVDADRQFLRTRERVALAARQWRADGKLQDRLLAPGRPLEEGRELLETRPADLDAPDREFLEASIQADRDRRMAAAQATRVRLRNRTWAVLIMAALAALSVGLGLLAHSKWNEAEEALARLQAANEHLEASLAETKQALVDAEQAREHAERASDREAQQRNRADSARQEAEQQRDRALRAQSRWLATVSREQAALGHRNTAILLALAALPRRLDRPDRPLVMKALAALASAAYSDRAERVIELGGPALGALFDPTGELLLTAGEDGVVRVWDAGTGELRRELRGHRAALREARFDPSGRHVLTASADGRVGIWDLSGGHTLRTLRPAADPVSIAAFDAAGARVVTDGQGLGAHVWDVASGQLLLSLRGEAQAMAHASFEPAGRRLITTALDGSARIWDAASGEPLQALQDPGGALRSAAFDASGQRVVTASADGTARVWDAGSGKMQRLLEGHRGPLSSATFDPAGERVATASADGTVRLWSPATGEMLIELQVADSAVNQVAFHPGDNRLAGARADGALRLWQVPWGQALLDHARALLPPAHDQLSPEERRQFLLAD